MDRLKLLLMGVGAATLLILVLIGGYTVLYAFTGPLSTATWKPAYKQGECLFVVVEGEEIPFKVKFVNMKKQTYLIEVLESESSEDSKILSLDHESLENSPEEVFKTTCPEPTGKEAESFI